MQIADAARHHLTVQIVVVYVSISQSRFGECLVSSQSLVQKQQPVQVHVKSVLHEAQWIALVTKGA